MRLTKRVSVLAAALLLFSLFTFACGGSIYAAEYKTAAEGGKKGEAVLCAELFALGEVYLCRPAYVNIYEGENAAQAVLSFISQNGFTAFYSGEDDKAFYLAYIADGDKKEPVFEGYKNSAAEYPVSGAKKLDIKTAIPDALKARLIRDMDFFDENDYDENSRGYIGEFVYSSGAGWMYSVNNVFPSRGLSEYYLSDGDVLRLCFTLCLGADIGGAQAVDSSLGGYYKTADKDALTRLIADVLKSGEENTQGIKDFYEKALNTIKRLDASQAEINSAAADLQQAVNAVKQSESQTSHGGAEENSREEAQSAGENESKSDSSSQTRETETSPAEAKPRPAQEEQSADLSTSGAQAPNTTAEAGSLGEETSAFIIEENGTKEKEQGDGLTAFSGDGQNAAAPQDAQGGSGHIYPFIIIAVTAGIAIFVITIIIRRKQNK